MLRSIKRTISSGGVKYDVTIGFEGVDDEQIQADAASYYVWKLQRAIRDADEKTREELKTKGIHVNATDVGKAIISTEKLVSKLSDEQALKAYELLKAKLGK